MSGPNWRQGCAVTRWHAERAVMRLHLPFMRVVQHPDWSTRWHALTDVFVTRGRQALALVVVVGLHYVAGPAWWVEVLCAPAYLAFGFGVGRLVYPHTRRGRVRTRYGDRGFADYNALRRGVAAHHVRTEAVRTRPSLRAAVAHSASGRPSPVATALVPVGQCGTLLGTAAVGMPFPARCYAEHQDVILLVAAPRTLKTAWMSGAFANHPGAALSTQTKPETFWLTREARAARARTGRVELLDPECLTGEKSTFRWPPHIGCRDWRIAQERGAAFAVAGDKRGQDGDNAAWFAQRATWLLRSFLLIADLAGLDMYAVHRWSQDVDAASEAARLMADDRYRDRIPAGWFEALVGVLNMRSDKTLGGIFTTVAGAVDFMNDADVAALCTVDDGEAPFDVRSFLHDRGTVYLIASEREQASAGPLMAVFANHLHEEAKRIAGPKGRLDPPLLESYDEAANTIVVPLPTIASDSGGRGIHVQASVQSKSQLRSRWGADDAETIWNCSTSKLIPGGLTVMDDLRELSELCGQRVLGQKHDTGEDIVVPRMTVDDIRELPAWHALLIHRTTPVTIVRITPAWELLAAGVPLWRRVVAWATHPDRAAWRALTGLIGRASRPVVLPAPAAPAPASPMPLTIDVPPADGHLVTVPAEWTAEHAETRR